MSKQNDSMKITVNDYLKSVEKSRVGRKGIDLSNYHQEISEMLDRGLSVNQIKGWFKANNLPIAYARLSAYVKDYVLPPKGRPKLHKPIPKQKTTEKTESSRTRSNSNVALEGDIKNTSKSSLPGLHDDLG